MQHCLSGALGVAPYSKDWQCHGSSRRDCPLCTTSINMPHNASRLFLLIGDSLDRSLVWRSCEAERSTLTPLCSCKNCFVCGPLADGSWWANLFLVGLLTPQQRSTPGALLPGEPPLAHQRLRTILPTMVADIPAHTPVTVMLAPGSWDALSAGEERSTRDAPAAAKLQSAFTDGTFDRACRDLIADARAALRRLSPPSGVQWLWHSAPAPHEARTVAPRGAGIDLHDFSSRMRLVSSVGTAAACSSGVHGLLDWRRWSCHHASYRELATGQHYNATGALLLASMLRSAANASHHGVAVTDSCRVKHPIWDVARGCCILDGSKSRTAPEGPSPCMKSSA